MEEVAQQQMAAAVDSDALVHDAEDSQVLERSLVVVGMGEVDAPGDGHAVVEGDSVIHVVAELVAWDGLDRGDEVEVVEGVDVATSEQKE